jgi:hypothetical protein
LNSNLTSCDGFGRIKEVQGIITNDSDLIPLGGKNILYNFNFRNFNGVFYNNNILLEIFPFVNCDNSFDFNKFLTLCIFKGGAYFDKELGGYYSLVKEIQTNKNYKEIINNIHNTAEPLKNQLKVLKSYIDTKKIYLSNIYQKIDIYLKEMSKEKADKNINQILQQTNINNMIPQNNQINTIQNLQGINLLNYMNINGLSHSLLFPLSSILTNNNDNNNSSPIFNSSINYPNILAQTRLNSLVNPLFP